MAKNTTEDFIKSIEQKAFIIQEGGDEFRFRNYISAADIFFDKHQKYTTDREFFLKFIADKVISPNEDEDIFQRLSLLQDKNLIELGYLYVNGNAKFKGYFEEINDQDDFFIRFKLALDSYKKVENDLHIQKVEKILGVQRLKGLDTITKLAQQVSSPYSSIRDLNVVYPEMHLLKHISQYEKTFNDFSRVMSLGKNIKDTLYYGSLATKAMQIPNVELRKFPDFNKAYNITRVALEAFKSSSEISRATSLRYNFDIYNSIKNNLDYLVENSRINNTILETARKSAFSLSSLETYAHHFRSYLNFDDFDEDSFPEKELIHSTLDTELEDSGFFESKLSAEEKLEALDQKLQSPTERPEWVNQVLLWFTIHIVNYLILLIISSSISGSFSAAVPSIDSAMFITLLWQKPFRYSKKDKLEVKENPWHRSKTIAYLEKEQEVVFMRKRKDWSYVEFKYKNERKSGWVLSRYLERK